MVERLTVIFFIILCLLLGSFLILAPWDILFGSWANNYILIFLTDLIGVPEVQRAVTSTWFRGGVTGLGIFNVFIAVREIIKFRESVEMLERGN
ncbi:MAG: hypothetical protein IPM50_13245 [Acidobacteriota bacterium]|nr:MAG: hypothetical protein IPM50_13245 [Acidobacteriota bacterium]